MNPDQWLKLIGVAVSLISACVWPAIIIFIIIYFRTPIRKFLDNMSEMSVKVGDVEATDRICHLFWRRYRYSEKRSISKR